MPNKETRNSVVWSIVLIGLCVSYIINPIDMVVSNGTHRGIVTAISYDWIFFKRYNVHIKTIENGWQEQVFCATKDIANKLQYLITDGWKVTINSTSYLSNGMYCWFWEDHINSIDDPIYYHPSAWTISQDGWESIILSNWKPLSHYFK